MEKIVEFVKTNKIKMIMIAIIIVVILLGIYLYRDYKQKEYRVEVITDYHYYILKNDDGTNGVIDKFGNIVIKPSNQSIIIPNPQKAVFLCNIEGKTKVFNEKGQAIFLEYEEIDRIDLKGIASNVPYEKSVLTYKENGKYGLINYEGKRITKPIYDEINGLENKEGEMLVKKDGKYGAINSKGAIIIKPEYESILADGYYTDEQKYAFSGYIVGLKTQEGYRYGYISPKLEMILKVEYNTINRILEKKDITNIYLIASRNGQQGVVKNGQVIINYAYQNIEYDDYNDLFKLTRGNKNGVSTIEGKEILPTEYQDINFNGIYIQAIKENGNYVYFDSEGNKIEDNSYESILRTAYPNYFITIDPNGKYGIVNEEKEIILNHQYSYIEYLYGQYFIATKEDHLLGVIDKDGNVIIDFQYEVLQKIDDTNVIEAKKLKENITELYNQKMEKIYSKQNIAVTNKGQYICIYGQDELKYFDRTGQELNNTNIFQNALYSKEKDGKWGFIDKDGNVVVDFIYDRTTEFSKEGYAGIKLQGKWGVLNEKGEIILEPTYQIETGNADPEFAGVYYKVYYGYGESYFTNEIKN